MRFRDKLYRRVPTRLPAVPTLGRVADYIEVLSFIALAGSILAFGAKGIAVALGIIGVLVIGPYLTAALGLFITFLSLLMLSVLVDGGHQYREFAAAVAAEDTENSDTQNR